jgi:NAD(P)-dependent dehydrogenase (short-subunit alcohol dehydrogenase family)
LIAASLFDTNSDSTGGVFRGLSSRFEAEQKGGTMRLDGKAAIITGGGSGIGKAIAKMFAREGASVIIAGRTVSQLDNACNEIAAEGGTAHYFAADVSLESNVISLIQEAMRLFGKIDVLVNNSGIAGPTSKVIDMDLNKWNETLAINLTGSMLCAREALKYMTAAKSGSIINVVSEAGRAGDGRSGYPLRCAYCASKMGQIGLTETLAVEMGEYGIRVNAVSPGPIQGERIFNVVRNRVAATGASFDDTLKVLAANNSLKRLATEEEVAAVALFLASDESAGVTGQTVPVSCGQHITF